MAGLIAEILTCIDNPAALRTTKDLISLVLAGVFHGIASNFRNLWRSDFPGAWEVVECIVRFKFVFVVPVCITHLQLWIHISTKTSFHILCQ